MDLTSALSDELFEMVLGWLAPLDVLRARCVCRRWRTFCSELILRRAAHDGPFMHDKSLYEEPDDGAHINFALPLFITVSKSLASDAIARSAFGSDRRCLMSAKMRAKLLNVQDLHRDMCPEHWDDPRSLPNVRSMRFGGQVFVGEHVRPSVRRVAISGPFRAPLPAPEQFPGCTEIFVSLLDTDVLTDLMQRWPRMPEWTVIQSHIRPQCVPQGVRTLTLIGAFFDVPGPPPDEDGRPGSPLPADGFWPPPEDGELSRYQNLDGLFYVAEWPLLEHLHVAASHAERLLGISAPALKSLSLDDGSPRLHLGSMRRLENVELSRVPPPDVPWLARQPLSRLCLSDVEVPNLDFLAAFAATIEHLTLRDLHVPPCAAPFAGLTRLKSLHLAMPTRPFEITNLGDVGALAALDTLRLGDMPGVTALPWLARLHRLRELTLLHMPALRTLEGIQHAPALRMLSVLKHKVFIANADALAQLRPIDQLSLSNIRLAALDLSGTALRTLKMVGVVCAARPLLPKSLRRLHIDACNFEAHTDWESSSAMRVLAGGCTPNLRHLKYIARFRTMQRGMLVGLPRLETLHLDVSHFAPGALAGVRADVVELRTDNFLNASELADLAPISLTLALERKSADILRVCAPSLRILRLNGGGGGGAFALEGVGACTRLESLHVHCSGKVCLEPLRGHPALREFFLEGDDFLDVRPLWTCPRLVVFELGRSMVDPDQRQRLIEFFDGQP